MKINEVEFDFDVFEADDIEKAKIEMEKVYNTFLNAPKNLDRLGMIKFVVKTIGDCFDNLFGQGSAKKIFKGKTNLKIALNSFQYLVEEIEKQDNLLEKQINDFTSKYSSKRVNRETRRKKQK